MMAYIWGYRCFLKHMVVTWLSQTSCLDGLKSVGHFRDGGFRMTPLFRLRTALAPIGRVTPHVASHLHFHPLKALL